MGYWNETCVCTNLPIVAGELCDAVVLLESPNHTPGCYTTVKYTPVAIVRGTYDSFGSLDNIECESEVMELLKKLPGTAVLDEFGNLIYTKFKRFHDFTDAAAQGLYVVDNFSEDPEMDFLPQEVRVVFLKPDIQSFPLDDQFSNERMEWLHRAAVAAESYRLCKENGTDESPEVSEKKRTAIDAISKAVNPITANAENPTAEAFFTEIWLKNPDLAKEMMKKLLYADGVMMKLRKAWHVPSGSGGQDTVSSTNDAFIRFYQNEVERMKVYGDSFVVTEDDSADWKEIESDEKNFGQTDYRNFLYVIKDNENYLVAVSKFAVVWSKKIEKAAMFTLDDAKKLCLERAELKDAAIVSAKERFETTCS